LSGQQWKLRLLERVRAVPMMPAQPTGPSVPPTGDVAALRQQVERFQNQVLDLQAQLTDAEGRAAKLQAQVNELLRNGPSAPNVRPAITDITLQLPRDAAALKPRPADQIKYLVFNHTAVDSSVGVDRIAASHQKRWGAILYHFFIAGDGAILQTNPVDRVVDLGQSWIAQGLNIAVAGNFTADAPSEAQLRSAAQLTAWLAQQYGLPLESVKGVSEFINTQSPGAQWLEGKNWKRLLLERVAALGQTTATPSDAAALAALRAQIGQLQGALSQAQASIKALTEERDRLLEQLKRPGSDNTQLNQQIQNLTKQTQTLTAEKAALTQQVQGLTSERGSLALQVQGLTSERGALAQQVQSLSNERGVLTQQVQSLTTERGSLAQQLQGLTNERTSLAQQLTLAQARIKALESSSTGAPPPVSPPAITDMVGKLVTHPTLKYATRTLNKITHITIHHSAAPANVAPDRVAAYHVNTVGWPGIGYHFYVEPDGEIFQVNRLETVSYHVGNSNSYAVGICVSGTFNGVVPTPRQIEQAGHLIAWLMQKLNIKIENIMGHKEFPENVTECPGNDWLDGKQWKQALAARVQDVLAGRMTPVARAIGHYLLFWQRQDAWAREDFVAATNYIARFRPTTGFSADDARTAEYVTIVGGVGGVPFDVEQQLIAAGCKVERLAGVDFADTKRMLDELAQSGRRFRTFNV
jgi:N-acetyl-anhydromuramyl-L-alanine amidase AmpD